MLKGLSDGIPKWLVNTKCVIIIIAHFPGRSRSRAKCFNEICETTHHLGEMPNIE